MLPWDLHKNSFDKLKFSALLAYIDTVFCLDLFDVITECLRGSFGFITDVVRNSFLYLLIPCHCYYLVIGEPSLLVV